MSDTDGQLLQAFAADRDEGAFRLLAKRHLGLIFHTALRRTGNRPLAEEISQNVLLALARKSGSLAKEAECLPGWLHRATLFEASKAMRAESSYQRRKQVPDDGGEPISAASDSDATWREALPQLDLALDKLPEADRRILLLHYFEDHPFPRIAERLGKNVAAVQKQAQRALEKLSRILRTKGVALSVTALGAGLATQAAKAVPEAFVQSASSFALSSSTSSLGFSFTAMISSKSKVIVPLTAFLLATPLVLQQLAIAREKDHLRSRRESITLSNNTSGPTTEPARASRSGAVPTASTSLDIMVLASERMDAKRIGGPMQRSFEAKLAALDKGTLAELIRKTGVAPLGFEKKSSLTASLVGALSKTDPGLAVRTVVDALEGGPTLRDMISFSGLQFPLARWAQSDPGATVAWLHGLMALPKFQTTTLETYQNLVPRPALDRMSVPLLEALAFTAPPHAADLLRGIPERERQDLFLTSVEAMSMRGKTDWLGAYLPLMRECLPETEFEPALKLLGAKLDRAEVASLLASGKLTEQDRIALAKAVAYNAQLEARKQEFRNGKPVAIDPATFEYLQQLVPGREEELLADGLREAAGKEAEVAEEILQSMEQRAEVDDSGFYQMLTIFDFSDRTPEALAQAQRITDPQLRQKVIDHLRSKASETTGEP